MDEKQQFEAWINSERPKLFLSFMSTARPPQYADPKTENLWQAWTASRAAIVVELPEYRDAYTYQSAGFNEALDMCYEVITDSGITVKGD